MSPALLDAGDSLLVKTLADNNLGCLVEVMKFAAELAK